MSDPVESLFAGNRRRLARFRQVRRYIEALGPIEIVPAKTQVAFKAGRQFAWAWLPVRVTETRPRDCIVLSFGLGYEVHDSRIAEATEARPGRWTHPAILAQAADFDAQVMAWLREAYRAAGARSSRPPERA